MTDERAARDVVGALVAALWLALVPAQVGAQPRDSVATVTVAPGVTWRRIGRASGPWVINVTTVNLRLGGYDLRQVRALDSLRGRERLSSMVARAPEGATNVLAALNTDFFDLKTGENENNVVIAGEWWRGGQVTDSPFDTFDNAHSQFALDSARRPMIDQFRLEGTAIGASGMVPLLAINTLPRGGPEASVLYTDRIGTTLLDTVRRVAESPMRRLTQRGDTVTYVRVGAVRASGGNAVPRGTAVLAGYGPRTDWIATLTDGDTVRVVHRLTPAAPGTRGPPSLVVGGWPRIVRDGQNVASHAPLSEGTISRNAEIRNPRSAIGFSRDSSALYLVTVDGRQASSVGMTLIELADLMREIGAWQALNFDGGGSTTMIVRGRIVNSPSDATGEREIASGLLVVPVSSPRTRRPE